MKLLESVGCAINGFKYAFTTQANFKIHLLATVTTIMLGIGLAISVTEWALVLLCFALVLFAELINTSIEKLSDVVQKEIHPEIKLVKDIAAGAVLVVSLISAAIGLIIFLPKIFYLLQ